MATKRIRSMIITMIDNEPPIGLPLNVMIQARVSQDENPEFPDQHITVHHTLTDGTKTINQMLAAIRSAIIGQLQTLGTGGHTIAEGEPPPPP